MKRLLITSLAVLVLIAACEKKEPAASPPPNPAPGKTGAAPVETTPAPGEALEQVKAQAEVVMQEARDLMDKYVTELVALGDALAGVQSEADALSASPKIQSIIDTLKGYKAEIDKLSPGTLDQLIASAKDRLEPVTARVRQEIERLKGGAFSSLESLLDSVPIIGG